MFCFNFNTNEEATNAVETKANNSCKASPNFFRQICPKDKHFKEFEELRRESADFGDLRVEYFLGTQLLSGLEGELRDVEERNLDLVPNVYEGGFKVWECSLDLAEFVAKNVLFHEGMAVLELGCGAGLPGIVSCLKGAHVDFQDYNDEVLELLTLPNAVQNVGSSVKDKCRFFAASWAGLLKQIESHSYDLILTSETIYNQENYADLLGAIKACMKFTGVTYLAAKTVYFGVGGGTRAFESFLEQDGVLNSRIIHSISSGVQREILEIKFKNF